MLIACQGLYHAAFVDMLCSPWVIVPVELLGSNRVEQHDWGKKLNVDIDEITVLSTIHSFFRQCYSKEWQNWTQFPIIKLRDWSCSMFSFPAYFKQNYPQSCTRVFFTCEHMYLGHVFHVWNFTRDFSHVEMAHLRRLMENFTCEKFHMWNFSCLRSDILHVKSHLKFHIEKNDMRDKWVNRVLELHTGFTCETRENFL